MLGNYNIGAVLAVKDLAEAREFYEGKLGLQVEREDDYGILFKSGDSKVYVYPSEFAGTNKATAAGWNVDDLKACVDELKGKGIEFEHYDLPGSTRDGDIHMFGDGEAKSAWIIDPSGNILALSEGM